MDVFNRGERADKTNLLAVTPNIYESWQLNLRSVQWPTYKLKHIKSFLFVTRLDTFKTLIIFLFYI